MKKIYLALTCMAGLAMMTACGGDKKADAPAAEGEASVTETTADETNADENNAAAEDNAGADDAMCTPAEAKLLDLAALYAGGDFKPAKTVIFEDTLGGEKAGELPSKWDIKEGSAEVGEAQGHNYIAMSGGTTRLFPKVGDGGKTFLPEAFTAEFEFLFGEDRWYELHFFDAEDNDFGAVRFTPSHIDWGFAKNDGDAINGNLEELDKNTNKKGWNHFALSFEKGNVKVFINGKRLANLPNVIQPAYLQVFADDATGKSHFIKSIRIAK